MNLKRTDAGLRIVKTALLSLAILAAALVPCAAAKDADRVVGIRCGDEGCGEVFNESVEFAVEETSEDDSASDRWLPTLATLELLKDALLSEAIANPEDVVYVEFEVIASEPDTAAPIPFDIGAPGQPQTVTRCDAVDTWANEQFSYFQFGSKSIVKHGEPLPCVEGQKYAAAFTLGSDDTIWLTTQASIVPLQWRSE